jgi:hypothetical protein
MMSMSEAASYSKRDFDHGHQTLGAVTLVTLAPGLKRVAGQPNQHCLNQFIVSYQLEPLEGNAGHATMSSPTTRLD